MWDFPDSPAIDKVTREIYERGGVVSAVCHGSSALVNVKLSNGKFLVDGKNLAAFTNGEEEDVQATDIVPFRLSLKNMARYIMRRLTGQIMSKKTDDLSRDKIPHRQPVLEKLSSIC